MTRDQVKRIVGYVRVSTVEQGDSGVGLEAQRDAIDRACSYRRWELVELFQDITSGKSTNGRHGLQDALKVLAQKQADGLVVAKLDRLSRSVKDFVELLDSSRKEGWALICLDHDLDTSTSMGEAMAHMAMTFAQLERRRIGERTREALAVVKARGPAEGKKAIGRPKVVTPAIEQRIVRMRRRGMSFEAIAARLTAEGIPTPKGGEVWAWTSVHRIAKRQGAK